MQIDAISAAYIGLAFSIEQHIEGFVDAYFGPPELKSHVKHREPAAIVADLADLRAEVRGGGYPQQRKDYLEAQLRGMETTARRLAGETIGYRDEVRACFDIEPAHTPEAAFEAANAELETLLPGKGSLAERLELWRRSFVVSPEVAELMIAVIAAEARARTSTELIAMPEGDSVEFALVSDKPWSGYNWYLGGGRSLVEINTDLPIRASGLLDLVCHEAYPGHHAEHALKEQRLYRERGWGEQAIQLINVPECVISEGIATLAADMIFGDEAYAWAAQQIYPLGGIVGDPEREARIAKAQWSLRALSGNAALLLHEQGADPEDVVQYIMRYGLRSEREARQSLRFISTPLWRTYTFTYFVGRDLLGRWIAQGDRVGRFRQLLTEQVCPSMLAA
ncbi:hypothetical protein K2Z83_14490 [Oscillochloris sp. ZM17-4]|uniref:hypothetical protein n=1 Tax=Oscillochloris sp. ZM17-4 TaxID=2866714 RepID=UPI001C72FB4F|nr:hypothetical protein [Oscillochloris sp. ZM17-4]MBX0328885.1 hypothetical protein [Oscillochloris sp. ZM17-4]